MTKPKQPKQQSAEVPPMLLLLEMTEMMKPAPTKSELAAAKAAEKFSDNVDKAKPEEAKTEQKPWSKLKMIRYQIRKKPVKMSTLKTVLRRKIEPVVPSVDHLRELLHMLTSLAHYSDDRIRGFPRDEKWPGGVGNIINMQIYRLRRLTYKIVAYNPSFNREAALRDMSVELKVMRDYVESAYLSKFITPQNWEAWSRKISDIDNFVVAMILYYQNDKKKK